MDMLEQARSLRKQRSDEVAAQRAAEDAEKDRVEKARVAALQKNYDLVKNGFLDAHKAIRDAHGIAELKWQPGDNEVVLEFHFGAVEKSVLDPNYRLKVLLNDPLARFVLTKQVASVLKEKELAAADPIAWAVDPTFDHQVAIRLAGLLSYVSEIE